MEKQNFDGNGALLTEGGGLWQFLKAADSFEVGALGTIGGCF